MQKFETKYIKRSKLVDCLGKKSSDIITYLERNSKHLTEFVSVKPYGKKHVAVIGAGMSAEREVSLMSSNNIINSLIDLGYQVTFIDMGADIANVLESLRPDVVYNALHGTYGEDGCLPGLLNIMRIPYTGPGVIASAIAFNKKKSREIFLANNIKIAKSIVVKKSDGIKQEPMSRPYVIKPLSQGSSVGVEVIFEEDDFSFEDYDFPYGEIIVEEYIKGKELQVAVLNGKAAGVLEIKLLKNKRFYDYEVKYTDGFAEHLCPAHISDSVYKKAMKESEKVCQIFECMDGIIRVEFIYNQKNEELYALELNTHPGMTSLSICPEILEICNDLSYSNLVKEILNSAKFEE